MEENTAIKMIDKIENELYKLEYIPEGFAIMDILKRNEYEYRRLPINNYVAIYRVDKERKEVYVIRIIYGGRNYLNEL